MILLYSGLNNFYASLSDTSTILLSLAIILFAGFGVSRLTKLLKLPNVSGYIIAGILIGPFVLKLVPENVITSMGFVSDIALAFIAFGVGKFFKKDILKQTGGKVIVITILEALLAGILVTLSMKLIFNLSWNFSLILGAIATATAPASTMMTINQYKAKGDFVNTLLQVVALDDVVCLLAFSLATALISGAETGSANALNIILPIIYNLASIIVGFAFGFVLSKLVAKRGQNNRLIIVVAMLLTLAGLCGIVNVSPLLGCMVFGATYINLTNDKELYTNISNFTPPIMAIFFVVSGMNLNLNSFAVAGVIGITYFIIRIVGKYFGAYFGCLLTKKDKKTRNYLGLALIPQAGVAIGLAFLGQRLLPQDMGDLLITIILSSSVMYELIGPACAKASLFLSGTIKSDKSKNHKQKDVEPSQENCVPNKQSENVENDILDLGKKTDADFLLQGFDESEHNNECCVECKEFNIINNEKDNKIKNENVDAANKDKSENLNLKNKDENQKQFPSVDDNKDNNQTFDFNNEENVEEIDKKEDK